MNKLLPSLFACVVAALPSGGRAQTAPLTGDMLDPSAQARPAQPAPAAAARPVVVRPAVRPAATPSPVAPAAAAAPVPAASAPAAPASAGRPVVRPVAAAPAPQPSAAVAAQPSTASAAQAGARDEDTGDVTRLLLAAQADGRRAGNELPMLGAAAGRAWQRYLDSFTHPIPERFDERVEDKD